MHTHMRVQLYTKCIRSLDGKVKKERRDALIIPTIGHFDG